ncbi:MAG TPA: hypothetical protein VNO33_13010 [Kofleriaceae bacterium]|nr:hypothetical protein [Kofleriaceae bacterium]
MFRTLSLAGALAALSLAGSGCVVSGSVRSRAYVEPPNMVLIEPGVYVVADYDQPVFYNDGYYWLYRDGYWARSYTYDGGWVRVRSVPYGVRRIHRPTRYVRYRAHGRARVIRAPVRGYRDNRGRVYRDNNRGRVYRDNNRGRVYRDNNRGRVHRDSGSYRARDRRDTTRVRDNRTRDNRTRDNRSKSRTRSRDRDRDRD